MYNSNGQCYIIAELYSRFFYTVHAANVFEVGQCIWRWLFVRNELVCCTHSRFHNTACVTKDDGCTSFHTNQIIELGIF